MKTKQPKRGWQALDLNKDRHYVLLLDPSRVRVEGMVLPKNTKARVTFFVCYNLEGNPIQALNTISPDGIDKLLKSQADKTKADLLKEMLTECDKTENEDCRLLVEQFKI